MKTSVLTNRTIVIDGVKVQLQRPVGKGKIPVTAWRKAIRDVMAENAATADRTNPPTVSTLERGVRSAAKKKSQKYRFVP